MDKSEHGHGRDLSHFSFANPHRRLARAGPKCHFVFFFPLFFYFFLFNVIVCKCIVITTPHYSFSNKIFSCFSFFFFFFFNVEEARVVAIKKKREGLEKEDYESL